MNVGVIGCGTVARLAYIPILRRIRHVRLAALAEVDGTRRGEAQRLVPGARVFQDYQELLRSPELDAVLISLPPGLHEETAVAALNAGKSIYLEKPIATSLDAARRVLDAWRRAGVAGMMGFNRRFHPFYLAARRLLQSGRLGGLVAARTVFSSADEGIPDWKRTRADGGGVLLDLASHHVDLMRCLLDREFTQVFAQIRSRRTEHDTAMLEMRAPDGLVVQSLFALGSVEEDLIECFGDEGLLRIDRYGANRVEVAPKFAGHRLAAAMRGGLTAAAGLPYWMDKMRSPWHDPSYEAALRHFVSAVRGGGAPQPDLLAGYRSLAVTAAAEEAAVSGRVAEVIWDEQESSHEG